jgi:putative glutamine amidotransferase
LQRPRIGITIERDAAERDFREYVAAVEAAGGEAVVLPPSDEEPGARLSRLDGLLLSGGEDVDPQRYGASPHPTTHPASAARDAHEIALARAAREAALPTLAICRGIQVANIAFGGTLEQHVPDAFGESVPHRVEVEGKALRGLLPGHDVAVDAGSRLATLAGSRVTTGSRHHQAIGRIAPGFRAVAHAPDGVVEALEPDAAGPFWLGVQWHPESTLDEPDGGVSRAIFRSFVDAARNAERRQSTR